MGMLQYKFKFIVMVCIFCSTATFGFDFNTDCKEAERNALLKLKHSFKDPLNHLGSWVGEDCCNWDGVTCDSLTSNVVELDMISLSPLHAMEVNPALLELKHLIYLDLSFLDFNGSAIPKFLGSMTQLQHLHLSSSNFSGEVPQVLGNLTELVYLDLSSCGNCYSNSLEWASRLENLQHLDLSMIDLSQATDNSLNLVLEKLLPALNYLSLSSCQLGNSPLATTNLSISSSTLQFLDLSFNSLSGPFPAFLQNLSSIEYLLLSHNQLNSSVPSWLADNTELQYVDLSNNQFDSVKGGILSTLGRLCSLTYLDLSNNSIQEEVSEARPNSFRCSKYDLGSLYMSNNNISGHLPVIPSFSSLSLLDLSQNNLETIPPFFGSLSSLYYLNLSYNHLRIVHQASLANLSSLGVLDISSNPSFLDVSPDWTPSFQLEYLYISHCKLCSPFPKWILSQSLMLGLDLSDAEIFGPLPDDIGNAMPSLINLRLGNNRINSLIPKSLCDLPQLNILDLRKNRLSGMIPDCWENSQTLQLVDLSSNTLSGPIPNSIVELSILQLLSLSNNSLEGQLPKLISRCEKLAVLDVGGNNLHGEIPPWNGANIPSLKILILRENRLKGMIPPQLCSVQTLQVIDLAENDLVGTIPRCFGHFEGMGSARHPNDSIASEPMASDVSASEPMVSDVSASEPTVSPEEWSAMEVLKGEEREYTSVLHLLVNIDLSCNNLTGVIPTNLTSLSLLIGLNLSHNHLRGAIPKEMGKMMKLESLDLSSNNLSGSIPESVSSLNFLSKMNLSFNNLHGQIPTGHQLQVLDDPSIYWGNPRLCGDPLPKKCFDSGIPQTPTSPVNFEDEQEDKHEKMWFYMVIMLGFASGFWGVIGILVVKRGWRHAYFGVAEEIGDWLYVRFALWVAKSKRWKVNVTQASSE